MRVGRAVLPRLAPERSSRGQGRLALQGQGKAFAHTAHVMRTMEAVAVAVSQQEATLLVGETGTGKSTLVQHIADHVSATLTLTFT